MENFYDKTKVITNLDKVVDESFFLDVPKDWYVLLTDIKDSTKAIEKGLYKDVNMLGALSIIVVLNEAKSFDIPFMFGGDGATLLIPPSMYENISSVMFDVMDLATKAYDMELRVAIIKVEDIYKKDLQLKISKSKIVDFTQAVFLGDGWAYAEDILKNCDKHILDEKFRGKKSANFKGLECRWKNIPSSKDETIALIIDSKNKDGFQEVFSKIDEFLGNSLERHPITVDNLNLSFRNKTLNKEASLYAQSKLKKAFVFLRLKFENLLGLAFMKFSFGEWGKYKNHTINTSDNEKFDNSLKMILSTNTKQREDLEKFLEEEYQNDNLIYGIHVAKEALMTCLIFERHGKHIHFVDAADGGYAMAAKSLKQRINSN